MVYNIVRCRAVLVFLRIKVKRKRRREGGQLFFNIRKVFYGII